MYAITARKKILFVSEIIEDIPGYCRKYGSVCNRCTKIKHFFLVRQFKVLFRRLAVIGEKCFTP